MAIDFDELSLPSPCYLVDLGLLTKNLEILESVQNKTGAHIILALKGFAMYHVFPLIKRYLRGTTASSLNEARLGKEEFGGSLHVCAPAYRDDEFPALCGLADHIVFNSKSQWLRFREECTQYPELKCGLRINPQHSEVPVKKYDPCSKGSRLGMVKDEFKDLDLKGITGLHFHSLCELNADSLERTLEAVKNQFQDELYKIEWMNFGGGHHITRPDYNTELLCQLITNFQDYYGLQVYLEPGEAIALNTGVLISTVLDIVERDKPIAILDTSATAHMPDVLEMPYTPKILGAADPEHYAHTYRLGGVTCLAGDVIGEYSFKQPLKIGAKIVFLDMAHYTMVKNTTFNGINLPSIATLDPKTQNIEIVREFGYEDYKSRLS